MKKGLTTADRLSRLHNVLAGRRSAFTMAEILLSLTIIGVVAAITLPSLTGNINERTWNTQRKALYARMSQAIALMPALNGYGTYSQETSANANDAVDTAAETFVTDGLAKVLKINNICDSDHLEDCGIVTSFTNLAGVTTTWPAKLSELNDAFTGEYDGILSGVSHTYMNPQKNIDTKAAAFETQNGESIAVYYNPYCESNLNEATWHYAQPKMCANFVYDLNGNKGPNTVGKDIGFITALYASDANVVAPVPLVRALSNGSDSYNALGACKTQDSESRLPNIEELSAMFYNKALLGYSNGVISYNGFWSGSFSKSGAVWYQNMQSGVRTPYDRNELFGIWCVKR